jgi:hypothetical protein
VRLVTALAAGDPHRLLDAVNGLERLGAELVAAEAYTLAAASFQQPERRILALKAALAAASLCDEAGHW